jgi:hypothetical protein
MVRRCLATRLGHPGKQGNRETWDGFPGPNSLRRGEWVNAEDRGMHGKLPTRLDRVLGPVSPFPASLVRDITDGIDKQSIKYLQCRADHGATEVLTASDHVED